MKDNTQDQKQEAQEKSKGATISLALTHSIAHQNGLYYLTRNGKTAKCPFATRVLIPKLKQAGNRTMELNMHDCGSHCPHFSMDQIPAHKDGEKEIPEQHVCRITCGAGNRIYPISKEGIVDIPMPKQEEEGSMKPVK